jgi:hypothetical protein
MKPSRFLFPVASLLVAFSTAAVSQPVGRVLLAAGEVFVVRDGKQVPLQYNSPIELKDVLRTGPSSSLQVRFIDEGLISVRENSEFAIEDYRFGGKEEESRSFFQLVKGGFRAVTGLIGRANHAAYRVRAETATIGIRGTDYAVRECRGDCGAGVKDGLYGTVLGQSSGTNRITLTNGAGESSFGINQHFYVPDANTAPQPLLQPPSFVAVKPQGRAQAVQQSAGTSAAASGTGTERSSPSTGVQAESRPAVTPEAIVATPPLVTQPFQVTETLSPAGTPLALPPANGFLVLWPGSVAADFFGFVLFDDERASAAFNGQNQLLSYAFPSGVNFFGSILPLPFAGSLAGGSITDTGSLTLANGQVFSWGRWTGADSVTSFTATDALATLSGVPLLFGTASGLTDNNVVGTIGGVANYAYAGGPKPVDFGGNVGTVTSSSASINFTQLTMDVSLGMNFPSVLVNGSNTGSASFSLTGLGLSAIGHGDFFGSIDGSCAGSGCGSSVVSGFFSSGLTGPNGFGAAVVGGLVDEGTQAGDVAFLNAYTLSNFTPGPPPAAVAVPALLTGQVAWSDPSFAPASTTSLATNTTAFNASGQPIAFANCATPPCPLTASLAASAIADAGSTTLSDGGVMNWGRWVGGQFTDTTSGLVTYSPPTGVPFVVGNANTTVPNSGSFVYSFAGAPSPVNTSGVAGTFTGGAFNVTFGTTQTISVATPLTMSVNSVGYSLNTCASGCSLAGPALIHNMSFNATSTAGPVLSATATGIFVGPQAAGLAVAGNVQASALPNVSFAAAFKR